MVGEGNIVLAALGSIAQADVGGITLIYYRKSIIICLISTCNGDVSYDEVRSRKCGL